MSGDLISKEDLLRTEQLLMTDIVKGNPAARYILEQVLYDIENAKTAYDVDKVVERLQELSDGSNDKTMESKGSELYWDGFGDGVDEAIKIIKAGGIE